MLRPESRQSVEGAQPPTAERAQRNGLSVLSADSRITVPAVKSIISRAADAWKRRTVILSRRTGAARGAAAEAAAVVTAEDTEIPGRLLRALTAGQEQKQEDLLLNREEFLREGERIDDLQRCGYGLIQDPSVFCFGMDAVLLSGFARVKKNEKALDLGCGNGIIPILLEAKTAGSHFTGLEIQPQAADMARRSVAMNGLGERISIVTGDIREADRLFAPASFDVVTSNPPYMTNAHGLKNPSQALAIARHEILCSLEDVVRQAARMLRPMGRFYLVHRPFRLAEIFRQMMNYKLEPKRLRLVYPYADREPNMVLIEGVKGGRPRITVDRPLIVYEKPGVYTPEIHDIYGY